MSCLDNVFQYRYGGLNCGGNNDKGKSWWRAGASNRLRREKVRGCLCQKSKKFNSGHSKLCCPETKTCRISCLIHNFSIELVEDIYLIFIKFHVQQLWKENQRKWKFELRKYPSKSMFLFIFKHTFVGKWPLTLMPLKAFVWMKCFCSEARILHFTWGFLSLHTIFLGCI